jgi:hypothetical protein
MITHLLAGLIVSGMSIGDVKLPTPAEESLQNAARLYRIQVYDTFRLDRSEFDLRRGQWLRLADSWETAGKPNRDVPALLHWLEIATANSRPDSIAPLPELPRIVADNSGRRHGSAWQTILQRLATDKLKAVSGSTASIDALKQKANGTTSSPDAAAAQTASDNSQATPKTTPVSATSTLNQGPSGETPSASETAPVPGADATTQLRDADATDGAAIEHVDLYHAYGERLGQNLGNFAGGLVRKQAQQDAPRIEGGESKRGEAPNRKR